MFPMTTLQTVSREMAGQQGVEKTPREWATMFSDMVGDYRKWHPEITTGLKDDEVWEIIREKLRSL